MQAPQPGTAIVRLIEQRSTFLSFVQGRVHDASLADDLLQDSFARAIVHEHEIRDEQCAEAWFYRLLRNAVTDHWRRTRVRERLADELSREAQSEDASTGSPARPCGCVRKLVGELKPEYSAVLEQVEVEGMAVKEFAASTGISASNAGARVHRAREALRRKVVATCGGSADGCGDCACSP